MASKRQRWRNNRNKRRVVTNKLADCESLEDLLRNLKIQPTEWDVLIVGDGSGTTWERECGWGSVLIDKHSFMRIPFWGGFNLGTVNVAEMMAYLHPILWLIKNRKHWLLTTLKIHIVTDSQYVANGINSVQVGSENQTLWQALLSAKRHGIRLTGHWIPRDTLDLNQLAHNLANQSRLSQQGLIDKALKDQGVVSLDELTPDSKQD